MSELVHPSSQNLDLGSRSLDQLGDIIREEDSAARVAAGDMLLHAIRAGEALNEAFGRVGLGKWEAWVQESAGLSLRTVAQYRRVAHYRQEVLHAGAKSVSAAIKILAPYPKIDAGRPGVTWKATPQHVREEARRLRAAGFNHREIADELQVQPQTVGKWLDPEYLAKRRVYKARKRAEAKAAKRALSEQAKQDARSSAARAAGGDIAKAYSLIRQTAAAIDAAASGCVSKDDARALLAVLSHIYIAEDEVSRVIRNQVGA